MTAYIVKHKNPKVPATAGGTAWAADGLGLDWTRAEAQAHATRCEFAVHGIPFEVVPAEPATAIPRRRDTKSTDSPTARDE